MCQCEDGWSGKNCDQVQEGITQIYIHTSGSEVVTDEPTTTQSSTTDPTVEVETGYIIAILSSFGSIAFILIITIIVLGCYIRNRRKVKLLQEEIR